QAPNKALFSILGKSNLRFAGMSIAVNISVDGLNLMIPTTRQIIANHHMQSISFASGGDTDTTDYVAYVAKDPINQRGGLSQARCPQLTCPCRRVLGVEDSAWGEDEEAAEHDYYNSIPGKEPPLGGLIDSRLRHSTGHVRTQPSGSGPPGQGGMAARRDQSSQLGPPWDLESQGGAGGSTPSLPGCSIMPRGSVPEVGLAVTQVLLALLAPALLCAMGGDSQHLLAYTGPFEDALKLHECIAGGRTSPPIEDQWLSPPTRKAPVAPTEEQLRREPWYHGKMSRRDAEKLLQMDGDFLVRDSLTNPGQYVLTGMHCGQPKHLLLVDPEGVVRTKDVLFESISHLINHHRQNEQPIVAAESELHLRQVVQRKQ
ncbi:SHC-transforming protein 2, partial [Merops nubicus]